MRRVVVGWSYDNARLYCQLRKWSFRDTKIVSTEYLSGLRAIRDYEVWILGPEWKFRRDDFIDIINILASQNKPYHYGETDFHV